RRRRPAHALVRCSTTTPSCAPPRRCWGSPTTWVPPATRTACARRSTSDGSRAGLRSMGPCRDATGDVPFSAKAATGCDMKLLVVEDDAALVAALTRGLRGAGFGVDAAGDAEQACELMGVTEYDLVVLDLGLPGADGLTLLRSIRQRELAIPV